MLLGLLKSQLDDMKALAPYEEGIVLSVGRKPEILTAPAAAALRLIGLDRFVQGRRKATARASLPRCGKTAQSRFLDNGHSGRRRSPGGNPHFLQHSTSNGDGIRRAPSSSTQGH
jgi:hypothetical protein